MPKSAAQSRTSGNSCRGIEKQRQQLVVPLLRVDIEKQRARRIGRIGGVHAPARQPPQQETIDGAECQFAGGGTLAHTSDILQNPVHFGCGKIRIEAQARFPCHHWLDAVALQRLAELRCAAILPDDGVVNALAGVTVPDQRGFALIRDANSRNVSGRRRRFLNGAGCHRRH